MAGPNAAKITVYPKPRSSKTLLRRCLFGRSSRRKNRMAADGVLKKLMDSCRDRWNFNFLSNVPLLDGRYQWIEEPSSKTISNPGMLGGVPTNEPEVRSSAGLDKPELCRLSAAQVNDENVRQQTSNHRHDLVIQLTPKRLSSVILSEIHGELHQIKLLYDTIYVSKIAYYILALESFSNERSQC